MDIYFSGCFAVKNFFCDITRHSYRLWKNCKVCTLQHSAVPINLRIFLDMSVCFVVALRPKSTAMVIAGRSVHLITLFPGQA